MSQATPLGPDQIPDGWNLTATEYDRDVWEFMTPYVREVVRHAELSPELELLDVAAGTGRVTIEAAALVKRVLATDFAVDMLRLLEARATQGGLRNVEVAQMDGQALELPDASFDRVVSNFGVIFFPDQAKGLREMHRVLRPTGRAVVSSWAGPEKFDMFRLFGMAARQALPDLPLPAKPPIFSLCEPEVLQSSMTSAGFETASVHEVTHDYEVESAEAFWELMSRSAPPAVALLRNLAESDVAKVQRAVLDTVRREKGDGTVILSNQAWVAVGTK